jgi:hypothetical protein
VVEVEQARPRANERGVRCTLRRRAAACPPVVVEVCALLRGAPVGMNVIA